MIELELFYNLTAVAIREGQAEYLKGQKRQPFTQELPEVLEASAETISKMKFFQKLVYKMHLGKQKRKYKRALRAQKQPVDERLTKGYNAGIEFALHILDREFKAFYRRLEKEEE